MLIPTRRLFTVFLVACFLADNSNAEVSQERPFAGTLQSYGEANALVSLDIIGIILKENKNLKDWADELEKKEPQTPKDVMLTYLACLRAGRYETVGNMIPHLFDMFDTVPLNESNRSYLVEMMFNPLKKLPAEQNKIITTFLETFDTIYCPYNDIANGFLGSGEEVAQWLETRWKNARERQQPNERKRLPEFDYGFGSLEPSLSRTAVEWQRCYLHRLAPMGGFQTELERLNNEAKTSPDDTKKRLFLFVALNFQRNSDLEHPVDLDWLIPTAEQRSAFEAWSMAMSFSERKAASSRKIYVTFLERALALPLTAEECDMYRRYLQSMSSMRQPERSDELIRAMFRVHVMDQLNEFYLQEKRHDDAQKIMLQAREIRKEYNLRDGNLLAGMTQAGSGQRVVENEILEHETEDGANPRYWMQRAKYYQGRKEWQEEEKAVRKAFELFDTPEARQGNLRWTYHEACELLFKFFSNEEAVVFFREQRALLRNEPQPLNYLYRYGRNAMIQAGLMEEYEQMLVEDIKAAWDVVRNTPKNSHNNDYHQRMDLARRSLSLVVQKQLLDFGNDPFAYEFLNYMCVPVGTSIDLIDRLLSSVDGIIPTLEKAMKKGKLSPKTIICIAVSLRKDGYDTESMPFWEESLRYVGESNYREGVLRSEVLRNLADCTLKLGNWRNGETYSVESYFQQKNIELLRNNLRRAAELAEKADEADEAKRIRQRLANLEL